MAVIDREQAIVEMNAIVDRLDELTRLFAGFQKVPDKLRSAAHRLEEAIDAYDPVFGHKRGAKYEPLPFDATAAEDLREVD